MHRATDIAATKAPTVTTLEDRRRVLAAAPGSALLLAMAACTRKSDTDARLTLGPRRSVTWAVGTTGSDFVLDIAVGVADAATMLGWRFDRVLNTQTTPDAHIDAIRQAVTARADVIITVAWYQAVVDEIASAMQDGVRFAIVNSETNPAELATLGVPFVGQDPYEGGRTLGERLAATLAARGQSKGTVLVGNPFPGSVNLEQRISGIRDGLATGAPAGGLRLVSFADGSAQDAASAVALYKAKLEQTGDVVAHAIAGGELSAVPLITALTESGVTPGQVTLAGWTGSLKMLRLIKSGWMSFALDDGLYYQGFLAVMLAWSMLERSMPAADLSPGKLIVTAQNVDVLIESYEKRRAAARSYGLS